MPVIASPTARTPDLAVVLWTAGGTVAPGTWNRVTATATAAMVLPVSPADGTQVLVENTSASGIAVTYAPGTGDNIEGSTAAQILNPPERVTLIHQKSSRTWYMQREKIDTTPATFMRRDLNGRAQVADPAAAADIMTRGFQDGKVLAALTGTVVSSATASTETIVLKASIPANSPYFSTPGRPVKIRLAGYSTSTGTLTFRVRAGAAGTTADAVGWTSITSVAQVANQRATIDAEAVFRTVGATGSLVIEGDGAAGSATLYGATAAPAVVTVNTLAVWNLEVSVTCSVASGFTTILGSIIVQ